jgi:hypothetical protein
MEEGYLPDTLEKHPDANFDAPSRSQHALFKTDDEL